MNNLVVGSDIPSVFLKSKSCSDVVKSIDKSNHAPRIRYVHKVKGRCPGLKRKNQWTRLG